MNQARPIDQERGTQREQNAKLELLDKCYTYLLSNFDNFSQGNKIAISLKLCSANIGKPLIDQSNNEYHVTVYRNSEAERESNPAELQTR